MGLWSWITDTTPPAVEARPAAGNLGQVMTWFLQGSQAAMGVTGARPEEGPGRIGWLRRGPYTSRLGITHEITDALANYNPVDDLAALVVETTLEMIATGHVDLGGNPHAMRRLSEGALTVQQAAYWAGAEETCHAVWFKRTYTPDELVALSNSMEPEDVPAFADTAEQGIDDWMIEIARRLGI